jgi:hypothetical protein
MPSEKADDHLSLRALQQANLCANVKNSNGGSGHIRVTLSEVTRVSFSRQQFSNDECVTEENAEKAIGRDRVRLDDGKFFTTEITF